MSTYIFDWSAPYDGCTPLAVVAATFPEAVALVGEYCVEALPDVKDPSKGDDLTYCLGSFKGDVTDLTEDFEVVK